jgi:hypothetical protein
MLLVHREIEHSADSRLSLVSLILLFTKGQAPYKQT